MERVGVTLALICLAVGVGGSLEAVRELVRGQDYGYSILNDAHFYRAMVYSLWDEPQPLATELSRYASNLDAGEIHDFYASDEMQTAFLHEENGLAHQPPYAYRIFVPVAISGLHALGIPASVGFLVTAAIGLILFSGSLYLLVVGSLRWSWSGMMIVGVAAVAVALVDLPTLVDIPALGLAMTAIVAAQRNRLLLFLVAATLAGLTRETGLVLAAVWVLYEWARGGPSRRLLVALAPIIAVATPRLLVEVPNPSIDLGHLMQYTITVPSMWLVVCTLGTLLLASPVIGRPMRRPWPLWAVPVVGLLFAVGIMAVAAFGTSRMALLIMPVLIAEARWRDNVGPWQMITWTVALATFSLADTAQTRVGSDVILMAIWAVPLVLTAALRTVAYRRTARDARTPA